MVLNLFGSVIRGSTGPLIISINRILLRIDRLTDIAIADCIAEGTECSIPLGLSGPLAVSAFSHIRYRILLRNRGLRKQYNNF